MLTDSLASLYLIRKVLYYPWKFEEHKHFHLAQMIGAIVTRAANSSTAVQLLKVKATHAGLPGNEIADELAKTSLENPDCCDIACSAQTNPYEGRYWLRKADEGGHYIADLRQGM